MFLIAQSARNSQQPDPMICAVVLLLTVVHINLLLSAEKLLPKMRKSRQPQILRLIIRMDELLRNDEVVEQREMNRRVIRNRRKGNIRFSDLQFACIQIHAGKHKCALPQNRERVALRFEIAQEHAFLRVPSAQVCAGVVVSIHSVEHAVNFLHRHRLAEIKSLTIDAVHRAKHIDLLPALHALGDDNHMQLMRHIHNGADDLNSLFAVFLIHLDELHIQLQHIDIRVLEHIQ